MSISNYVSLFHLFKQITIAFIIVVFNLRLTLSLHFLSSLLVLTRFPKDFIITIDHRDHGTVVNCVIQYVFGAIVTRAENVRAYSYRDIVRGHQILLLM